MHHFPPVFTPSISPCCLVLPPFVSSVLFSAALMQKVPSALAPVCLLGPGSAVSVGGVVDVCPLKLEAFVGGLTKSPRKYVEVSRKRDTDSARTDGLFSPSLRVRLLLKVSIFVEQPFLLALTTSFAAASQVDPAGGVGL